jgi:hypothetical protein
MIGHTMPTAWAGSVMLLDGLAAISTIVTWTEEPAAVRSRTHRNLSLSKVANWTRSRDRNEYTRLIVIGEPPAGDLTGRAGGETKEAAALPEAYKSTFVVAGAEGAAAADGANEGVKTVPGVGASADDDAARAAPAPY